MAIRDDFTAGEVLAAADLNDTFGAKANLASPTFTGTPAAPTAAVATNTTQIATTAFVLANAPASGLALISPSSIANSGGSASASGGAVTFTGVSSVSLNGVFTSAYENYRMMIRLTGSTALTFDYRMRTNTDDSSSVYWRQEFTSSNLTNTGQRQGPITLGRLAGLVDTDQVFIASDISGAHLSEWTSLFTNTNDQAGFSLAVLSGGVRTTTQYTGISFLASTGTVTGTIRVYGYKNS
jgi:hypothetical protein